MTSANVTKYRIDDLRGMKVGEHSQHHYCKTHWGDLLKFNPPEDFVITAYGMDEEEEEWEDEPMNLAVFIERLRKHRAQWNTMENVMRGIKK